MLSAFVSASKRNGFEDKIQFFDRTKGRVTAYFRILAEHGLENFTPASITDWQMIPLIDKRAYVQRFAPDAVAPDGRIPGAAHSSSGSSGEATFWFRGHKQKQIGAALYERVIYGVMNIPHQDKVLVIVCFGMGMWIAGAYTLLAFGKIAEITKRCIAVIAPGMEIEDVSSILCRLTRYFDHVIMAGYPAALDVLFKQLATRKIALPEKLHLITSGDKISESWRDTRMAELGIAVPSSIVSVYGSADGGLLAIETPLTIELRRKLRTCPELAANIFGDTVGEEPALFQFDPHLVFFEEVDGEIVFTADLDIPLIRYNIHDRGRVIPYEEMMSQAKGLEVEKSKDWQFPFLAVSGRTDIAVAVYGANIYPEALRRALSDPRITRRLSGSFLAYSVKRASGEEFCLDLQLSEDDVFIDDPQFLITLPLIVQERLIELSSEYRNSCRKLGEQINRPTVTLYRKSDPSFPELVRSWSAEEGLHAKAISAFYSPVGKKPRIVAIRG
jgi:phenylacetate-CoA ligase